MLRCRNPLIPLVLALVLAPAAARAESWVRLGLGAGHMAMDDINDADFRFYDETINGYDFPDVGTGLQLDLGAGYDLGPDLGVGFFWDRQWAKVKGNDDGVDGTLGLHANAFMGRVTWRPLRGERWRLGVMGGMGPLFSDGYAKISRGTVNYGQSDLKGNCWAFDAALSADTRLGGGPRLQAWAGWRWAKIDEFRYQDRPALKEDGSPLSLDYTGWFVRVGLVVGLGG